MCECMCWSVQYVLCVSVCVYVVRVCVLHVCMCILCVECVVCGMCSGSMHVHCVVCVVCVHLVGMGNLFDNCDNRLFKQVLIVHHNNCPKRGFILFISLHYSHNCDY